MNDNDIRAICLRHRDRLDRYRLSERQVLICRIVLSHADGATTLDVADVLKSSIHSAGTALAKLVLLGYLRREGFVQASGGIQYKYYGAM